MTSDSKKNIPVPAEKALKDFYSFLALVKEDLECGILESTTNKSDSDSTSDKRVKMSEQLQIIAGVLPKHLQLEKSENAREQELVGFVTSAEADIKSNFPAAEARWVDLLLDKVSDILDSTQHVNLERLTNLMEQNDEAGVCMEGKDVILLLGSPGCGKTTTLHYLAGTSFLETTKNGVTLYRPGDVVHPDATDMKVSCGGKEVITRHLQIAEVDVQGKPVILCDTPSFGGHEATEEVIANSLGLVRAIQRAKTVRPIIVLSRDEIGHRDSFNAYPQILTILIRLLGSDSNVNLEPLQFVFTKYDTNNATDLQKQLDVFLKEAEEAMAKTRNGGKNTANQHALLKHLINRSSPHANIIIPTEGDPDVLLEKLMEASALMMRPENFVPNMPEAVLNKLKRQLKFTLLDLRDALSNNDNGIAIYRMQQMSKLANLLPEAGLYARHGFKAFKEIINQLVEDDGDEDDYDVEYDDDLPMTKSEESNESWTSTESVQWSNVSSKLAKASTSDAVAVTRQLSIISEEGEVEIALEEEGKSQQEPVAILNNESWPSQELLDLAAKCEELQKELNQKKAVKQQAIPQHPQQEIPQVTESVTWPSVSQPVTQEMQSRVVWSASPPPPHQQQQRKIVELPSQEEKQRKITEVPSPSPSPQQHHHLESAPVPENQPYQPHKAPIQPVPQQEQKKTDQPGTQKPILHCKSPGIPPAIQPNRSLREVSQGPTPEGGDAKLPDEEVEYTEQYSAVIKEMTVKAIEEEDYVLAVQRMHEFVRLSKGAPDPLGDQVGEFKKVVELFLVFSVAIQEGDYPKCLQHMQELIAMSEGGHVEAKKCSELGVRAAINHITDLRERVVHMTGFLHAIEDPDEFDSVLEQLRREREKVEHSNIMLETCMRASDDRGKSETVLACISYGFKVGRLSR